MTIKIGIVGIGNVAAAFVQGIYYYGKNPDITGLGHKILAGYSVSDLEIVAAVDISEKKVDKDLSVAIFEGANQVEKIIDIPIMNVTVTMGNPLDGIIEEVKELVTVSSKKPENIVDLFKKTQTELVICLLPSGGDNAVKFYAEAAINAKCGFINATPTAIATDPDMSKKFFDAGLPLIGDDLQDQMGSTILHKMILKQLEQRGVKIIESYALDVGGGTESLNTIHRARGIKRNIKSESIKSALKNDADIVAGTSDYVSHLKNRRNTLLWIVGEHFNGQEITIDMKISTNDGANGGSIIMDVIRASKVALIREEKGPMEAISAYGFKKPPGGTKMPEDARKMLADFILG